jgi:hypothetical protein
MCETVAGGAGRVNFARQAGDPKAQGLMVETFVNSADALAGGPFNWSGVAAGIGLGAKRVSNGMPGLEERLKSRVEIRNVVKIPARPASHQR